MTKGWHGEPERHALASRGIKSARDPKTPIRPVLRYDVEDHVENMRNRSFQPLWITLSEAYGDLDDPEIFEQILSHYGWEYIEDDDSTTFIDHINNKSIIIDDHDTVTVFDNDLYERLDESERMDNIYYHRERFDNFEDAFEFAIQQVSFDIKEKHKVGLTV